MPLQGMILNGPFSFNATSAITAANVLVSCDTAGGVTLTTAAGCPIGSVQETYAINTLVTVYPPRGRHLLTASAQLTAGDFVKAAASGQVAPEATVTTRTAFTIGIAETAAAGSGSLFWMMWI